MGRLQETRLEANVKKEAEKIGKHGKNNTRIGNFWEDCSRSMTGRLE